MTANDIRNICLLGHGGSGKTTLAEQMLFMTKGTDRLGRTADGNTVCDYDAEEIKRQISISLAFAPVKYKGVRINVMDAPGNFDFSGEAVSAIRAAECAVLRPSSLPSFLWSRFFASSIMVMYASSSSFFGNAVA